MYYEVTPYKLQHINNDLVHDMYLMQFKSRNAQSFWSLWLSLSNSLSIEQIATLRLVEELKRVVAEWYGGSSTQHLSRIISAAHFHRLRAYLQHPGTAERVVAGGQMDESRLFIAPTLLRDVPWDAPVLQEEVFGPILTIQSVCNLPPYRLEGCRG